MKFDLHVWSQVLHTTHDFVVGCICIILFQNPFIHKVKYEPDTCVIQCDLDLHDSNSLLQATHDLVVGYISVKLSLHALQSYKWNMN